MYIKISVQPESSIFIILTFEKDKSTKLIDFHYFAGIGKCILIEKKIFGYHRSYISFNTTNNGG